MRFSVTWSSSAQNELMEIWLASNDRAAVTAAAHAIDQALAYDPQDKGDEFYGDRVLVSQPIAVVFAVIDADRLVRILQVWN